MEDIVSIKVAEVNFNREYKPAGKQFIIYYFNLVDEFGETFEFSTNGRNQTKFLVGQTYEVLKIQKQSPHGPYYFIDLSDAEKERRKAKPSGGTSSKGGDYKYVKPRKESIQIITQSSYEAAIIAALKIAVGKIKTVPDVNEIATMFTKYVISMSGYSSSEALSDNKEALKKANELSIIYQKAIKLAILYLDFDIESKNAIASKFSETHKVDSSRGILLLATQIAEYLIKTANEL